METPYMYLFVREDLSVPQQIVQTSHAVNFLNHAHPHNHDSHFVLCGTKSEDELIRVSEDLMMSDIKFQMFFELDINGYTAIATVPLKGNERKPMKRYNTLK